MFLRIAGARSAKQSGIREVKTFDFNIYLFIYKKISTTAIEVIYIYG